MASPMIAAKRGTLQEFLASIDEKPGVNPVQYLNEALANRDPQNRVDIVNWMLDKGADASATVSSSGANVLHVLCSQRTYNAQLEAPMLQRLLSMGADLNGFSPRWGYPLAVFYENTKLKDAEIAAIYDLIFATPNIDWEVPVNKNGAAPQTLRELVESGSVQRPEMTRRMLTGS